MQKSLEKKITCNLNTHPQIIFNTWEYFFVAIFLSLSMNIL